MSTRRERAKAQMKQQPAMEQRPLVLAQKGTSNFRNDFDKTWNKEIRNNMTSLTYFYLEVGFVVAIAIVYNLIAMHRDNREAKYWSLLLQRDGSRAQHSCPRVRHAKAICIYMHFCFLAMGWEFAGLKVWVYSKETPTFNTANSWREVSACFWMNMQNSYPKYATIFFL